MEPTTDPTPTDWRTEAAERKARILATLERLKLTVSSEFVPWSRSRNAGEKCPSLNWRVTLKHDGRDVLTTDYMAGIAHGAAHKASAKHLGSVNSLDRHNAILDECATGKEWTPIRWATKRAPLLPDPCDVLYSLTLDASVLDARSFEDWAADFGYDTDSRKAEATYRACLEIALRLRNGVGEAGLAELRDVFEGY